MKQTLLLLSLFFAYAAVFSQTNQWTWIKGDTLVSQYAVYGTKGVPTANNKPGARQWSASWTDKSGNLWLFSGAGYGSTTSGYLNDLWKYDTSTMQWAWMSGSNSPNQSPIYGTKGVAAAANMPGARNSAITWTDPSGNLWVFGGTGYAINGSGELNDLWKYTPSTNQWAWVSGDSTINQHGIYQDKNIPAPRNVPGGRHVALSWADKSGNLWLFGGTGYSIIDHGFLNDLWKYDPVTNLWTWVSGDNTSNNPNVYGVKGIAAANTRPGGRPASMSWADTSGNFWLFGGNGSSFYNSGSQNDLWKFNTSTGQWAWMSGDTLQNQTGVYGTLGTAAVANKPGARQYAANFSDADGNLWLFGGSGYAASGAGYLNDLWKYTISTGQWSWMKGDSIPYQLGYYGTQGIADPGNKPTARQSPVSWSDKSGNLWAFGGNNVPGEFAGNLNDLWKYNTLTGQWTWASGTNYNSQTGYYGTKGISSTATHPGIRYQGSSWTDASGNLWLFGGTGDASGSSGKLSDLWKYTISSGQWTWMSGANTIAQLGVYGSLGVAAPENSPGARINAMSWTGASGDLWLYGGFGHTANADDSKLNDLWKYSPATGQWTWVNGSPNQNQPAVYGTKGMSDPANSPGSRQVSTTWKDNLGNLWLFGGMGYTSVRGEYEMLSDLWKYNPGNNQWTWMGGNAGPGELGDYGMLGIAASSNKPGARNTGIGWTDAAGNLWLFGGWGYNINGLRQLNDLWKYNTSTGQWTWVNGDKDVLGYANYGTKNITAATNKPGSREKAIGFNDATGNLWLFGGTGFTDNSNGVLNDLWKYNPSTNQWTWMSGDNTPNQTSIYGQQGIPGATNKPGARLQTFGWTDAAGKFWLFGGDGYSSNGRRYLNDFWQYAATGTALPVRFTRFTAQKQSQEVALNWTTALEQNSSSFIVERSANGTDFDSIGKVAATGFNSSASNYSFTDKAPLSGAGYYRLRQLDKDGGFLYSAIQKITMDDGTQFVIIQNPVQHNLMLRVQLPVAQKITLQVRDISGHLIQNKEFSGKKGESIYSIPVGQLASGSYFINLQTNSTNSTKTFVTN